MTTPASPELLGTLQTGVAPMGIALLGGSGWVVGEWIADHGVEAIVVDCAPVP